MSATVSDKSNCDVDDFINKLLASQKFDELVDKVAEKAVDKMRHIENPLAHLTDNITGEEFHTEQPGYKSNEHHKHSSNHELDKHMSIRQNKFNEKLSHEIDMDGLAQLDGFREKPSEAYDKESPFYHRIHKEEIGKEFIMDSKYKDKSSKEYDKESSIHTVTSSREIDKKTGNEPSKKTFTEIDPNLLRIDKTLTLKKQPHSYSNDLSLKYQHTTGHTNARHNDQTLEKSRILTFRTHKKDAYREPTKKYMEKVSNEETHFQDNEPEPIEVNEYHFGYENHEDENKNMKHEITFSDIEKGRKDVETKVKTTQSHEFLNKEDFRLDLEIQDHDKSEENEDHFKSNSTKPMKGKEAEISEEPNPFAKDYVVEKFIENIKQNKSMKNTADEEEEVLTLRTHSKSENIKENKVIASTPDNLGDEKDAQESSTRKPSVRKEGRKFYYTYVQAPEYEEYFDDVEKTKTENKEYKEKEDMFDMIYD